MCLSQRRRVDAAVALISFRGCCLPCPGDVVPRLPALVLAVGSLAVAHAYVDRSEDVGPELENSRCSVRMLAKKASRCSGAMYLSTRRLDTGQMSWAGSSRTVTVPSAPTCPAIGPAASMAREPCGSASSCLHQSRS